MVRRYYLIPLDAAAGYVCPLHLDLIGQGFGYPSSLRGYYIVAAERDDVSDFAGLESQPEVVRVWREAYTQLAGLGVDVAGLTEASTDAEIGARVLHWLQLDVDMSAYGIA